MLKKVPDTPVLPPSSEKTIEARLRKEKKPAPVWPWLVGLLVVGLVILGIINFITRSFFDGLHLSLNPTTVQPPVTTLDIQRTAPYAGLAITVLNAQYATSFADDTIRPGPATVRVNIRVTNKTAQQIDVVYYDILRLLLPGAHSLPIAPTNILSSASKPHSSTSTCLSGSVSAGPPPGSSETDCVDFPVPRGTQLKALSLQLGLAAQNETLVTIPFSGAFSPNRYADKLSSQNVDISYTYFNAHNSSYQFLYHLVSVRVSYAYNGVQSKAGQQFYILDFRIDNLSGVYVTPGFAYDYVRLLINGTTYTPIGSTLPNAFNANAKGVSGQVAFAAPAGASAVTIGFLPQNGGPIETQDIQL